MKKLVVKLSFSLFALGISNMVFGQVDKEILNWYNGGGSGLNTTSAYKALKKKTSTTVVVAIIDSGIDIEHEDLKGKIWVNEKEIPGNGIDDDNNGYIDDVHGWNFLGSPNGVNQQYARLEKVRMYAKLKDKFDNVEESNVAASDKEEYQLYKKLGTEIEEGRTKYQAYIPQLEQLPMILKMVPGMVANAIGKSTYTKKDLDKWKPSDPQMMQIKTLALAIESGDFNEKIAEEQLAQIKSMIDYHYNVNYDDRQFIGDDADNFKDVKYGNNDVEGPDALHGTHVGGIVGAIRGNNLGGDGVADNVKLMSLRAVPDGDEADKDIALAIRYAADNGASIINMSFGKAYSPHQKEVYEALKYADSKGVLLVHAAGNDAKNLDEENNFPADKYSFQDKKLDHYLTIGASTRNPKGELAADFSNFGVKTVDVFAPGHEIYNAVPQSEYKKLSGTSMAAPAVSGVAAMLKSYFPEMTMLEIKNVILSTAKPYKGTQQNKPGTEEKVDFGTLSITGAVVDLNAAVKKCLEIEKSKSKK